MAMTIQLGVVETGQEVGRTGTGNGQTDGWPAGQFAVGTCRERGGALVTDPDGTQITSIFGSAEGIGETEVGMSDHPEHRIDTPSDQSLDHRVRHGPVVNLDVG
jgi:hypothetical protein